MNYKNIDDLVARLEEANLAYRSGTPIILDSEYDSLVADLAARDPNHPYLHTVEPEPVIGKNIQLPKPMLSTQKAYSLAELKKWFSSAQEAAHTLFGTYDVEVRVTPKLDGFAAQGWVTTERVHLATRGDGQTGQDITTAIDRGLRPERFDLTKLGTDWTGLGEIVVRKDYFERYLSDDFENTRNVISAAIKQGELDPKIANAIKERAIVFVPFHFLPGFVTLDLGKLVDEVLDRLWDRITDCPFETDGLVFELTSPELKEYLGSTNHHHRWQIAYKRNTEFHDCKVTDITWQTARTGRITPVVNIEPTRIGGVTVSNVTGHHAGNVLSRGIGAGAVVKVTRAGQVIPHIVDVISPAPVAGPNECPSCGGSTAMDGNNLYCVNTLACPAQVAGQIEHFFKTIGECDGFGPAVIDKLCDLLQRNNIQPSVNSFCVNITQTELEMAGISPGIARNLVKAFEDRRLKPIEDWKLLAAFGIPGIGRGVAEKLLTHYSLLELVRGVGKNELLKIDGIGSVLVDNLFQGMNALGSDIAYRASRFTIIETKNTVTADSPIAGKTIVFTGTMVTGKRGDMEKQAKALGATVTSSVSAKTDYLVAGENVGANKTAAAEKFGVTILTEQEYLALVA